MRVTPILSLLLALCTGLSLTGCGSQNDPSTFVGRRILFACDPNASQEQSDYHMIRLRQLQQSNEGVILSIATSPYTDKPDQLLVSLDATPTFEFGQVRFSGPPKEANKVGIQDGVLHASFTVNGSSGFMSLHHTVQSSLALEPLDDGVLKIINWDVIATHHKTGELRYRDNITETKGNGPLKARCFYPIQS